VETGRPPGSDVEITTPRGRMPAYVAVPQTAPPWPGVVVVHDFTGMSADLRRQADWLAGEGFLAVAPDLYWWGSRLGCLWTIMGDIGRRAGRTFDDVEAARTWAAARADCTGRIGIIGFCMGGGYAVALAPSPGYSAAAVNYGGCPKDADEWLTDACPIVASFGGADRSPLGGKAGLRLDRILTDLGIEHDVKVYPGVGHGFMNDHDPADLTPLLTLLSRVSGTRFDAAATADARQRIAAFFDTHLRHTDTAEQTAPATGTQP
jgi:carboxymethylenebutenolidase